MANSKLNGSAALLIEGLQGVIAETVKSEVENNNKNLVSMIREEWKSDLSDDPIDTIR